MAVRREHILAEIRRTAVANDGVPLGRDRFEDSTDIRPGNWLRYWARWGNAVRDAGFEPNQLRGRFDDDAVIARLVSEIQRFGRMPTVAEMRLRHREDNTFPSRGVYEKLGPKSALASKVAEYCRDRPELADVLAIVEPLIEGEEEEQRPTGRPEPVQVG
jgi:hypothetical protein